MRRVATRRRAPRTPKRPAGRWLATTTADAHPRPPLPEAAPARSSRLTRTTGAHGLSPPARRPYRSAPSESGQPGDSPRPPPPVLVPGRHFVGNIAAVGGWNPAATVPLP
ncbi:hypothetical protein GCM10023259_094540 [Thermocatellispora tengchongensis]